MKILTYKEWVAQIGNWDKPVPCFVCKGCGETTCGACHYEAECELCEGSGEIVPCELDEDTLRNNVDKADYIKARDKDIDDWCAWTGEDAQAIKDKANAA